MARRKSTLSLSILREFGSGEVSVVLDKSLLKIAVVLRSDFSGLGGARGRRDFRIDTHGCGVQMDLEYVVGEAGSVDLRL